MPIYIAMLRGINVGGHNKIKMEELRVSLEALSFKQVQTYIQSGNAVFRSGKLSPASLAQNIEQKILADFGFSPLVITRSAEELGAVIAANPFLIEHRLDPAKLHVVFLAEPPTPAATTELLSLTAPPDLSHLSKREIYLFLPNGMSQSTLWNNPIERRLLKRATTRNWNTVTALYKMAQALV